jgi:biotin carboxylase
MSPRVILLATARSYRLPAFLEAAARLGIEAVAGMDVDPELGKTWRLPLGLDFSDPEESVRRIVAFARERPVAAVLGIDDSSTVLAALASAALGLPHNAPGAAIAARDKHRMRELLLQGGVRVPGFQLFSSLDDPFDVSARVRYPCVVKPVLLSGSRGVIRADDAAEFVSAFRRTAAIASSVDLGSDAAMTESAGPATAISPARILVEDFVPGREFALEGILSGGKMTVLALFDKPDPLDGPFFEETIYVTPSRLPPGDQDQIANCAALAAAAIGLREGPIHAELRLNADGPWVVEVAGRSIGGLCSRILRFGTGMSLEALILRQACGMEIETRRAGAAVGVMMIPIPGRGMFRGVSGTEAARAIGGVEDVQITAQTGYPVVPLPEGASYLGFIFASGQGPAEVEDALRAAHGQLRFEIEPEILVVN